MTFFPFFCRYKATTTLFPSLQAQNDDWHFSFPSFAGKKTTMTFFLSLSLQVKVTIYCRGLTGRKFPFRPTQIDVEKSSSASSKKIVYVFCAERAN